MCTLAASPSTKELMARRAHSTEIQDGMDRFFLHQGCKWQTLLKEINLKPGSKAYVARQAAQWFTMAADAEQLFFQVNREYVRIV